MSSKGDAELSANQEATTNRDDASKNLKSKWQDSRSFARKATTNRDYAGLCLHFKPCACIGFSVYRRATAFILPGRVSGHENTLARGNHVVYPFDWLPTVVDQWTFSYFVFG
jgi:hypothetical protein